MLSTTEELVCGTLTAPLTVAPAVASEAVELVTSAWWPRSEEACSAWLDTSEFESAANEVLSWLMPCTSLKDASWLKNSLLSTGLVGSWFCSCASMSVRKSVPPSVTPFALPLEVLLPFDVLPLAEPVPLAPPAPGWLVACMLLSMISDPWK